MPACEDSTSIDCARVVRGRRSIENAVTRCLSRCSNRVGSACSDSNPITTAPGLSLASCSAVGGCTHSTISASANATDRSEEHTSELQSLMRISYAVFCLKKKIKKQISNKTVKQTD